MAKQSDEIINQWAALMAQHQRDAEEARDPAVKKAYFDLVDGYRRLIDSEITAMAIFVRMSEAKQKLN